MPEFTIAKNELKRLFSGFFAWINLAIVQFWAGASFFIILNAYLTTNTTLGLTDMVIVPTYRTTGILVLLTAPFVTMGLFTSEYQFNTIKLLLSSPISITEIVIGKYLGVMFFYMLMFVMLSLMPIFLLFGSALDLGVLCAIFIGFLLFSSALTAIGLFSSTLTRHGKVSAVINFGFLFILTIMVSLARFNAPEGSASILSYLSFFSHYDQFLQGLVSSTNILYYLLITLLFLGLSIWRLDMQRNYA